MPPIEQYPLMNAPAAIDYVDGTPALRVSNVPPAGTPAGTTTQPINVVVQPPTGQKLYDRKKFELVTKVGAYVAGRVVGGTKVVDVSHPYGGGIMQAFSIFDDVNQKSSFDIYFANEAPAATYADDDVWSTVLTATDLDKFFAVLSVSSGEYKTVGTLAQYNNGAFNRAFASLTNLWVVFVTGAVGGTPTYGATNVLSASMTLVR